VLVVLRTTRRCSAAISTGGRPPHPPDPRLRLRRENPGASHALWPRSPWMAGLCLGHTARRFGRLGDQAIAIVESLVARAEANPSDVDGRALDGRDDVRWYLRENAL